MKPVSLTQGNRLCPSTPWSSSRARSRDKLGPVVPQQDLGRMSLMGDCVHSGRFPAFSCRKAAPRTVGIGQFREGGWALFCKCHLPRRNLANCDTDRVVRIRDAGGRQRQSLLAMSGLFGSVRRPARRAALGRIGGSIPRLTRQQPTRRLPSDQFRNRNPCL